MSRTTGAAGEPPWHDHVSVESISADQAAIRLEPDMRETPGVL